MEEERMDGKRVYNQGLPRLLPPVPSTDTDSIRMLYSFVREHIFEQPSYIPQRALLASQNVVIKQRPLTARKLTLIKSPVGSFNLFVLWIRLCPIRSSSTILQTSMKSLFSFKNQNLPT
ncbi:unnamed protein product [Acanthoscelides obtectus]|uniref:Uncharacterized protein n=1 Tax=Acanthoscelides obtectus TaxID=200917 RepID=A0A9P0M881_ACAOB|nr:unnamed protein product [Acanthoscelides obtectus]CAK1650040.1 hypothetical protein AOBTE_LOCUS16564 [Acanthoscelides obtectus]